MFSCSLFQYRTFFHSLDIQQRENRFLSQRTENKGKTMNFTRLLVILFPDELSFVLMLAHRVPSAFPNLFFSSFFFFSLAIKFSHFPTADSRAKIHSDPNG